MSRFTLQGRWYGEAHDPERHFTGTVVEGGHTGLPSGSVVSVRFQADRFRVFTDPVHTHGGYSLEGMTSDAFVLTSFVRKDNAVGYDAQQDGEEQIWGGEIYS
jgi:hypothetical protein